MAKDAAMLLVEFGFTELEAEIYLYLLGASPSTGYKVAKGIRKPAANTYKALQTLAAKGATLVEDGAIQQVSALPYAELLDRLEREFSKRQSAARKAFQAYEAPTVEEGVYQLGSWESVIQRATELLNAASSEVIAVGDLADLATSLKQVAGRGVSVLIASEAAVGTEEEFRVGGFKLSLLLSVDGKHVVLAHAAEGMWISRPGLVGLLSGSIRAQAQVAEIVQRLEEGAGGNRIARVLNVTRSGKADKN